MGILLVHHVLAWCPKRPEEGIGIGSPETGVKDGHEPPYGC